MKALPLSRRDARASRQRLGNGEEAVNPLIGKVAVDLIQHVSNEEAIRDIVMERRAPAFRN